MRFFQEKSILKILSTVLFVWCKHNPEVSYGQGMNEILASIVYAYFQEVFTPECRPDGFADLNSE
jgi:TBC1 domain family protein 5